MTPPLLALLCYGCIVAGIVIMAAVLLRTRRRRRR